MIPPEMVPRENYQLAVRYWRARERMWRALTVAALFGGASIAWAIRGLLP